MSIIDDYRKKNCVEECFSNLLRATWKSRSKNAEQTQVKLFSCPIRAADNAKSKKIAFRETVNSLRIVPRVFIVATFSLNSDKNRSGIPAQTADGSFAHEAQRKGFCTRGAGYSIRCTRGVRANER